MAAVRGKKVFKCNLLHSDEIRKKYEWPATMEVVWRIFTKKVYLDGVWE